MINIVPNKYVNWTIDVKNNWMLLFTLHVGYTSKSYSEKDMYSVSQYKEDFDWCSAHLSSLFFFYDLLCKFKLAMPMPNEAVAGCYLHFSVTTPVDCGPLGYEIRLDHQL